MNHKLILSFTIILLILFFSYVFFVEHEVILTEKWKDAYISQHITTNEIEKITHDERVWSYNGVSTCVCYGGDFDAICDKSNCVCAGDTVFGDYKQQVLAVKDAVKNNGEHQSCPVFYYGTM